MASVQYPLLGRRLGAHDAVRVYNAVPASKNKVLHWCHAITDYLVEGLWYSPLANLANFWPLPPKTCWRLRWMVPYMPGKNKWIILMKVGECSCYWILLPLKSRSNLFFQKLGTLQLNKCIAHFKKRGWTSNFFMIFDNHISNGRDLSEILLNSILSKGGKHLHRLYFFSSLPPCWASRVFGVEINYWGCSDWHNPL